MEQKIFFKTRLVSDSLNPPPADLMRKDAPGMKTTRTIYHVLLRAPQTSEAISIRRRDPTICPSSHTALIVTKPFFPPSFNPLLDIALRSLPSLWVSLPTPPTAHAQISSLRHGLLTPSVGFRQSPARPNQGKVAVINHLPQSLSVSLGRKKKKRKVRSCDSGGDAFGSRCRVVMRCPFSTASTQATNC